MHDASPLAEWANFYVITGSSAAALTGLMFVVITLAAGSRTNTTKDGISIFSTPTVVHFCAALFISVVLSAPWRSLVQPAIVLGVTSLFGLGYTLRVLLRTLRITTYRPDLEDWCWFVALPAFAYVVTLAAALRLAPDPTLSLFLYAGATILLVFLGIHNAWDVVTYIAVVNPDLDQKPPTDGS
ncbi:MAG: hypothetical protein JO225_09710 [Candidatus Eremiobacteraeota bacterium]|nr:hypothetical protein [Candidatus Eremiobacteraeota bacterium]